MVAALAGAANRDARGRIVRAITTLELEEWLEVLGDSCPAKLRDVLRAQRDVHDAEQRAVAAANDWSDVLD